MEAEINLQEPPLLKELSWKHIWYSRSETTIEANSHYTTQGKERAFTCTIVPWPTLNLPLEKFFMNSPRK